jgi:Holliday junction resolvasome RuvABC endonuclease subunit
VKTTDEYETFKKVYNLIWYGEAEKRNVTDVVKDVITAVTNDTIDSAAAAIRSKMGSPSTTPEARDTLEWAVDIIGSLRRQT